MELTPKRIIACCLLQLAASFAAIGAPATKMGDGFTTVASTIGQTTRPGNSVTSAKAGNDVLFWVQWKEPIASAKLRCLIKEGGASGETVFDETDVYTDAEPEGYSFCGLDTERNFEGGTYYFAQYMDGEKVGEGSIAISGHSVWKVSRYRQFKWALGGLAAIILAVYWVRKKMYGDKTIDAAFPPAAATQRTASNPVAIGSKLQGATAAPAPPSEADELRKCGLQYKALMAQPDKSRALELARRHIGLLLLAHNETEALKVFKECLAIDPAFKLAKGEDVLPLAKAARAAGDPQSAVSAVRGFDKAFPGHMMIPDVFVFTAKLMAEIMNNPAMARKILEHVLQKYPGHYLAQEAKRYLQAMPA